MRSPARIGAPLCVSAAIALTGCVGQRAAAQPAVDARSGLADVRAVRPEASPRSIPVLLTRAGWMTPRELKTVAGFLGAKSYHVAGFDTFAIVDAPDGALVRVGADLGMPTRRGDALRRGLFWNTSDEFVRLRVGEAEEAVEIPPRGMFAIGWLFDERTGAAINGTSCSIFCGEGFYACCNAAGQATATCKCIADGHHVSCQSGGMGATSCSVEQTGIVQ
ncbi:MAG: hypothetical protein D6692_00870 [Planctomycetota bacterium]|nr:MAG: hypothetical protein D6692_00870 [Planctomycetota bacterium]